MIHAVILWTITFINNDKKKKTHSKPETWQQDKARSVCLWFHDRAVIHQNTIVPASTVAPPSRLVAKWQNADWPTVWLLPFCSFLRQTHSFTQSTRDHSVQEWLAAFIKGKTVIFGKVFGPHLRGGERANVQTSDTNSHANLEPSHPTLFQFPVNSYNSICLQAVKPNPILSSAGSDTATKLCSMLVCEGQSECVLVCWCVPQEAWGMNSVHRNAQLSLGVFTSEHLLYVFGWNRATFSAFYQPLYLVYTVYLSLMLGPELYFDWWKT